MKMKKIGKKVCGLVKGIMGFCLLSCLSSCMFNNLGEASMTAKKLADGLYYMELEGDDGFDQFLAQGGAKSAGDLGQYLGSFLGKGPFARSVTVQTSEIACAAFLVPDGNGGFLMGRNYDWDRCTAIILKNSPDTGYASVSTCNLDFLGFGEGFKPEGIVNKIKALAGIYVPMDGVNEKGLAVADLMAGDDEVTNQDTDKPDLTTTSAIRLLLNKAANVDEAINLLKQYDMHSDIGTAHHLFIGDASGKSVVVEWVDNEMYVTEANLVTNHYVGSPKAGTGSDNSKLRYSIVEAQMNEKKSQGFTEADVRDALESIKAGNYDQETQWSIVYSLGKDFGKKSLFWRENYKKAFSYDVK